MRVLIADDHDLLRDTLTLFIEKEGDIECRTVPALDDAVRAMETEGPFDLVLLDYHMPGMNGLAGLERMRALFPDQPVAILSGQATRDLVEKALEAGACGYVPKTLPAKSLVNAIRFMVSGERFVPVNYLAADPATGISPLAARLSPRELEVLRFLTRGKSNKAIAIDLDLTEATIKLHVKSLYRKIGVANRTQAAIVGLESGIS